MAKRLTDKTVAQSPAPHPRLGFRPYRGGGAVAPLRVSG
jgi:hypothetical protein